MRAKGTYGQALRGLTDILFDLQTWTQRREPAGFVLPNVYPDIRTRDEKRSDLAPGVENALSTVDDLTPKVCSSLDADTAEVVGLAIVIQVYEFLRDGGWEAVVADELAWALARLEYVKQLLIPIGLLLDQHPGDADRSLILRKLGAMSKHLNQIVREGRWFMDELGIDPDPDAVGELPSFDPVPDEHETPAWMSRESTIGDSLEEVLSENRRRALEAQEAAAAKKRVIARRRAQLRIVGLLLIPALSILAVFSILPLLKLGTPAPVKTYTDIVPVQYMFHVDAARPCTVFVVDESWDHRSPDRQLEDLLTLHRRVSGDGASTSIVIRNGDGLDLARVEEGTPVLLQ